MRQTRIIIAVILMCIMAGPLCAQPTAEQRKEAEKIAKQEAKKLKKEGWQVTVGCLPMETQLTKAYLYQMETDVFAQPKYVFGQAISGGGFYDAAKIQASELAKAQLADNISSDLHRTVSIMLENKQISQGEFQSCSDIIQRGTSSAAQRLTSIIPLIEIYRNRKDGGVEVQVRLAYEKKKAMGIEYDESIDNENASLIAASQYMAERYYDEQNYEKALEWGEKAKAYGSKKADGLIAKVKESISGSRIATITWLNDIDQVSTQTYELKIGINSESKIKEVDVMVNGIKVRGINVVANDTYDMTITRTFVLKPGNNTIKVRVKNSDGTTTAQKEIVYSSNQKTIGNTSNFGYTDRRIALVIGNSNYQDNDKRLVNPQNDASDLATKLRSLGFEVILLTDADRRMINQSLYEFGEKADKYDVALFYYAGHGIQSKGINYLIPVDAELKAEDDVQYNCINANQVLDKMEQCKAKIVILDACRNNPFERSWHRGVSSKGLTGMTAPEGCFIAYATNPGNVAQDGKGRNSPYTEAMLKTLDKPNLSLESFFKEVLSEVKRNTNGAQTPWISSSFEGDFYFNQKQ